MSRKALSLFYFFLLALMTANVTGFSQNIKIEHHPESRKIIFGNSTIGIELDYEHQANISFMTVNGQEIISGKAGIYSAIETKNARYSTLKLLKSPTAKITDNKIEISGIRYGDNYVNITEKWIFTLLKSNIRFDLERSLSKAIEAEQLASPAFQFKDIHTWDGAFQDYGGLAWFYLFKRSDTYGVHSQSVRFWNSTPGNGLDVQVISPNKKIAMDYSRTAEDKLAWNISLAQKELTPRFDTPTFRRRFIRNGTDVWAPVRIEAGSSRQSLILSSFDFNEQYGRGDFVGVDGKQVSDVLNTIARIGVIDKNHFGGNSWHTPYGPICLHEQYIAQMGLAINDSQYLKGYQDCLDFYRDHAVKPDGRVWARWAYTNEDAMPGEFTSKGFYEAQWGYLLDANPDLVTNVAELYDLTGDRAWVKTHQRSCEKALDWIIKRDRNHNGLVEMMCDSMEQKRSSDWIDIIWASYENAFVNAKLYHALQLWAKIEGQLGNTEKENYYTRFALQLKTSFNKSAAEGGFWDDENKCFIHWREKDGSLHGRNMVTPVNFMAIAYGLCDDPSRIKSILDGIETQMQKEKLFFWPLCLYSYAEGEGNDWQFPFPNYENGDIFLSWGALGVKAYAAYRPEVALKYVKNILAQYAKDGLAFQRYGRATQDGLGDDILSGNCLSVVGLYQAIYGINPLHNRFYLDPHITQELSGTKLNYHFRNQRLTIGLAPDRYTVANKQFTITSKKDFGFFSSQNRLSYFNGNSEEASLVVTAQGTSQLTLEINSWDGDHLSWTQSSNGHSAGKLTYQITHLKPDHSYHISINSKALQKTRTSNTGVLEFTSMINKNAQEVSIDIE